MMPLQQLQGAVSVSTLELKIRRVLQPQWMHDLLQNCQKKVDFPKQHLKFTKVKCMSIHKIRDPKTCMTFILQKNNHFSKTTNIIKFDMASVFPQKQIQQPITRVTRVSKFFLTTWYPKQPLFSNTWLSIVMMIPKDMVIPSPFPTHYQKWLKNGVLPALPPLPCTEKTNKCGPSRSSTLAEVTKLAKAS